MDEQPVSQPMEQNSVSQQDFDPSSLSATIDSDYPNSVITDSEPSVAEDDSSNLDRSDSMPDLIWPEKKIKGNVKLSESRDTGFNSDSVADTPSPEDEEKNVTNSEGSQQNGEKASEEEEDGVMDILGNGLLIKKILEPGVGEGTRPNNGDNVTIRVDGVLEDGKHVDIQDFNFTLGDGDVIVAFDIAVALMELGEKCELKTAPRYAYDELGRDPDIPKDATITYTIELLDIQAACDISTLAYEKRLELGELKRERGNYLYSRQDFSGAINSYSKAVKILDDSSLNASLDEASRSLLTESWVKCYNNMAACQLKINAYDAAIRSCEKVLSTQENNVKALFRLAKAYGSKNEVDEALKFIKRAIKLDPESKMLHQEMLNLTRRKNKETNTEKQLYQRMLGVKPNGKAAVQQQSSSPLKMWAMVASGVAAIAVAVGMAYSRMS